MVYLRTVFALIACQEASLFGVDSCSCTSASTFYKLREIERCRLYPGRGELLTARELGEQLSRLAQCEATPWVRCKQGHTSLREPFDVRADLPDVLFGQQPLKRCHGGSWASVEDNLHKGVVRVFKAGQILGKGAAFGVQPMALGTALAVERFANVGLHLCRLILGR